MLLHLRLTGFGHCLCGLSAGRSFMYPEGIETLQPLYDVLCGCTNVIGDGDELQGISVREYQHFAVGRKESGKEITVCGMCRRLYDAYTLLIA